ncbi:transposase [Undibacterium sp. RTI2.1]|nr:MULTISPECIES: transposase [unclassified Undibacterium]MEB0032453.1 transposase [Undibacterium sp. RTI2.1]MEB0118597.1 transposase [Undibacterium sp. RTI2.2]
MSKLRRGKSKWEIIVSYTTEFKIEAVKQIDERGHSVVDVSKRLGVSDKSLYLWVKQYETPSNPAKQYNADALKLEVTRLKAELKRTTEQRDILKKAAAGSTGHRNSSVLMAYSSTINRQKLVGLDYHLKRSQSFGIVRNMGNH